MRLFLIFTSGFIAGVVTTIVFAYLLSKSEMPNDSLSGLTTFSEKGDCIATKKEIKVLQVVKPNMALAETVQFPEGILVLLINYDNKSYYDDQKIRIPPNKCARQIGIYNYTSQMGVIKTVPAVVIE